MSLFRDSIRPPSPLSDEAVERYVVAIRASIQPDPLYRRRLRGHVLNRYVVAREGIGQRRASTEISRIGRAVLYASFALSLSVTGAMAASQQAIPGEVLYSVKLQIEELRLRVVPEHLHDELAGYSLARRIAELDELAAGGDADAVAAHADVVRKAYARVLALSGSDDAAADELSVAGALLDRLPERARAVVESVLADLPGVGPGENAGNPGTGRDPVGDPPNRSQGGVPADPARPAGGPAPTQSPQAQPTKSPQAQPTQPPPAQPSTPPRAEPTKPANPGNAGGPSSTPEP